jgi:hypothetical protein
MSFFLLILLILAVGGMIFFIRSSKSAQDEKGQASDPPDLTIENVRAGGVIGLSGVGPDAEDFDLVVNSRHIYDEDGFLWYDLECDRGGKTVWIGIEDDDELKVWLSLKKMDLGDVGLTPDALKGIGKQGKGDIEFDDRTFRYKDRGKAVYYKDGNRAHGEKVRYWDFETDDGGAYSLGVEEWGKEKYAVYYSESLRPAQITVYGLSDD